MVALIIKMTFWLVTAMVLGFLVAWLLFRTIQKRKEENDENSFSELIREQKSMIDKLEKDFRQKEIVSEELSEELLQTKESLAEKTSLVTTLQNRLDTSGEYENDSSDLKAKKISLLKQIEELKQTDIKRKKELDSFGEIVTLAEERVEENEKKYKKIIKDLDYSFEQLTIENKKHKNEIKKHLKTIQALKESLKLYEAYSSEPEFIISRDQFIQIEKQLTTYQKEIETLKLTNEKSLLQA